MAFSAGGSGRPDGVGARSALAEDSGLIRAAPEGHPYHVKGAPEPHHARFRMLYEKRVALFAILASLPGIGFATSLIWTHHWTRDAKISLTVLLAFLWLVLTLALLDQVVRPLQTMTNVVGALREEDYSFRARSE